jgi:hypothetical protein
MFAAVANLFPRHDVDEEQIHEVYKDLTLFRRERIAGDVYTARAFEQLVRAAGLMVAAGA